MIEFDTPQEIAEASLLLTGAGVPTLEDQFNELANNRYEEGKITLIDAQDAMLAFHIYIHRNDQRTLRLL